MLLLLGCTTEWSDVRLEAAHVVQRLPPGELTLPSPTPGVDAAQLAQAVRRVKAVAPVNATIRIVPPFVLVGDEPEATVDARAALLDRTLTLFRADYFDVELDVVQRGLRVVVRAGRGGRRAPARLRQLATADVTAAHRGGRRPRSGGVMAQDADTFRGERVALHYAMARYLCFYLQEQGKLREYYAALKVSPEDPTGYATLQRVLGEADMGDFQRRWEAWGMALE